MGIREKLQNWLSSSRGSHGGQEQAPDPQDAPETAEAAPEIEPQEPSAPADSGNGSEEPVLDNQERQFFRLAVTIVLGLLFIMVFAFFVTFLVSLRGKERTMVPDLNQMELVNGLMDLQEKELYPRVQVRFSSNPSDKGKIVSQDPLPGTVVKAGRRVTLVVSKGAVVNRVDNYIGRELSQVRMDIQAMFTSQQPLLRIQDPVVYIYNETPEGTILEQNPEPGTEISGLTELELWVSRGPKGDEITVGEYIGMDFRTALSALVKNRTVFTFETAEAPEKEPGTIVSQSPAPGVSMDPGERIRMVMTPPRDTGGDQVFGLFEYTLQEYPVAVDMRLESVSLSGMRETVLEMKHPGGEVTIPYVQPAGRELVLYVYDKEVLRTKVEKPEKEEAED